MSGGGSGSPREGNEAWRTPTEQVTFSCDGEVDALLLRTLPSKHDRKTHSIAGGWLAEALYKMHGGKEVTKALLTRTRITFKGGSGVEKTLYATHVPESSEDYCDLITRAPTIYVLVGPFDVMVQIKPRVVLCPNRHRAVPVSVPQSVCRPLHLHPLRGLPRYTPKPYTLNPNPHLKGL